MVNFLVDCFTQTIRADQDSLQEQSLEELLERMLLVELNLELSFISCSVRDHIDDEDHNINLWLHLSHHPLH